MTEEDKASLSVPLGRELGESLSHRVPYFIEDSEPTATRGRVASVLLAFWGLVTVEPYVLRPAGGTLRLERRQFTDGYDAYYTGYRNRVVGGYIVSLDQNPGRRTETLLPERFARVCAELAKRPRLERSIESKYWPLQEEAPDSHHILD